MAGFGNANPERNKNENKQSQKRVNLIIESAIKYHLDGDLFHAENEYRKAIEIGSDHHAIFVNLGVICGNSGRIDEAIVLYNKAIEQNPENANAYSNLGYLYFNLGNFKEAAKLIIKSLELNPNDYQALLTLGWSQKELTKYEEALKITLKSLEIFPDNPSALVNLGAIYKDLNRLDQALEVTIKALKLKPDNPLALINLGSIYQDLGQFDEALESTLKSLKLEPHNPSALINLSSIYKDLGQLDESLSTIRSALEIKPNDPYINLSLGDIYKEIGLTDQSLTYYLRALKLKPECPNINLNLGLFFKDIGDLNKALSFTLQSLELKLDNPGAIKNINSFIDQLGSGLYDTHNITRAYNLLLNRTDVSHRRLSGLFRQKYFNIIQKASEHTTIISEKNDALQQLAKDTNFHKSISLFVPPIPEVEIFLTRLREEILLQFNKTGHIHPQLESLTKALAMQCFLNEYTYYIKEEEKDLVSKLITKAEKDREIIGQKLLIISCYKSIYTAFPDTRGAQVYSGLNDSYKELLMTQLIEPSQEEKIKSTLDNPSLFSNKISQKVENMYESNPYPRYKYANFTKATLSQPIAEFIKRETTKQKLNFSVELTSPIAKPKVLIAGCGTGNQVISASRYKNAKITAIDLSSSSLAYASRKSKEYGMNNVEFKKMDILNLDKIDNFFDIIECSGVLHHMENPPDGLAALIRLLKPGGYIKLGLYSEIARSVVIKARDIIQRLHIDSSAESIREFRKQVLDGEISDLKDLPKFGTDFFSLSECKDLCFHVQEHLFTTEKLQNFLNTQNLDFCGFMVPIHIKQLYQKYNPEDGEMTSLKYWGNFEKKYPSTFKGMYQFWAHKPKSI